MSSPKELVDVNAKYLELQEKYAVAMARNKQVESILERVDQLEMTVLTCVICEETCPSLSSLRLLPCAHIFCVQCLSKWIKQAQDKYSDSFECPLCRKQHQLPKVTINEEWPHPHFLSNFLKCAKINSCSNCHRIGKQDVSWFCPECQETYCDHCKAGHDSLKTDHDVTLLSDISATPSDEQLYCEEHKNKSVEVYCRECDVFACAYCTLNKHKGHNFVEVSEVAGEFKEIIGNKISEASEAEEQVKSFIVKIQEVSKAAEEKMKQVMNDIDRRTEEIIINVKASQESLHSQAYHEQKMYNERMKLLQGEANVHLMYLRNYKKKFAQLQNTNMMFTKATIGQEVKPFGKCDDSIHAFALQYKFIDDTCDAKRLVGEICNGGKYCAGTKSKNETDFVSVETQTQSEALEHSTAITQTETIITNQHISHAGNLLDRVQNVQEMNTTLVFKKGTTTRYLPAYNLYTFSCCDDNQNIILGIREPVGLRKQETPTYKFEMYDLINSMKDAKTLGHLYAPFCDVACRGNQIYISESNFGNIHIYKKETCTLIETINIGTKGQNSISITGDFLYITSCEENSVYRLDLTNVKYSKNIFANDKMWNLFKKPSYIASDENTVAVSCTDMHNVHVFNSDGSLRFICGGSQGNDDYKLDCPRHVCIDNKGNLIIADDNNFRIAIISPFGCLLGYVPLISKASNNGIDGYKVSPITTHADGRLWFPNMSQLHVYTYE